MSAGNAQKGEFELGMGHPGVAEELGGNSFLLEFGAENFVDASVEGVEGD